MKRYRSFSEHLRQTFGCRVFRVPLDAGFSCPNRDPGNPEKGGCIFCGERGSGARRILRHLSVAEQLQAGKEFVARRYGARRFLAYFQAYTNTLADPERLRRLYDTVLSDEEVVGLMVGTRPDCLPEAVLDLLASYRERTHLWLEVGIQSIDDAHLSWMGRGHDHGCTVRALEGARGRGIPVCGHFIFGLPGEGRDHIRRSAEFVNDMGLDGVKIHLLHVVAGTELDRRFQAGELDLLGRDEYVERVCDFLERLSPGVIIHRLTGDGGTALVAPTWSATKAEVLKAIEDELLRRDSWQGKLSSPAPG